MNLLLDLFTAIGIICVGSIAITAGFYGVFCIVDFCYDVADLTFTRRLLKQTEDALLEARRQRDEARKELAELKRRKRGTK